MSGWHADRRGTAFQPAALRAELGRATDAVQLNVAKYGYRLIHQYMKADFKHPTGYYQSRVLVDATQGNIALTDHGVIYGPRLEKGFGRFRGYAMFRRTQQAMEAAVPTIAQQTLAPYLRRFG